MKLREQHSHSPRDVSRKLFSGRFHKILIESPMTDFFKKTTERWTVDAVQLIVLKGCFNIYKGYSV